MNILRGVGITRNMEMDGQTDEVITP